MRKPKFSDREGKPTGQRVLVHISPSDNRKFSAAAKRAGMTRSDWMRDCCLVTLDHIKAPSK